MGNTREEKYARYATEQQIEEAILQLLNASGFFAWKNHTTGHFDGEIWRAQASPFAINGASDIIAIKKGQVYFLEVKTVRGKQSEVQKKFQDNIEANGGIYMILRSCRDARELLHIGDPPRPVETTSKWTFDNENFYNAC